MPTVLLRMWSMGSSIVYCLTVLLPAGSWSGADTSPIRILPSPFIKIRKDYAPFVSPRVDCEAISVSQVKRARPGTGGYKWKGF